MRTSTVLAYTAAFVIGSASALTFPKADAFDSRALLQARSPMPDAISSLESSLFEKRQNRDANGPEDCGDDEEYVPYTDEEKAAGQQHDDDDDDSSPSSFVDPPSNQHAVATSSSTPEESSPSAAPAPSNNNTPPKDLKTPDNIAEGTYTVEEGCIRYYTPVSGDVCLGLVEKNSDVGLTLDQLYCLNPAIDDQCYNLWIGTSYCVGYGGSEPLNTGVSSKA